MNEASDTAFYDILASIANAKIFSVGWIKAAELDAELGCAAEESPDFMAAWNKINPNWDIVRQEVFVVKWNKEIPK